MEQLSKRAGADNGTRTALLDAAEGLIRVEGYGAVTARRLGEAAGVKHQLIFYYFESVSDLLLEVFRRASEKNIAELELALKAEQPLRALWNYHGAHAGFGIILEFSAIATHEPAIRQLMAAHGERVRAIEELAIHRHLRSRQLDIGISPKVLTVLVSSVSRALQVERMVGMSFAHAETEAFIEAWFQALERVTPWTLPDAKTR